MQDGQLKINLIDVKFASGIKNSHFGLTLIQKLNQLLELEIIYGQHSSKQMICYIIDINGHWLH